MIRRLLTWLLCCVVAVGFSGETAMAKRGGFFKDLHRKKAATIVIEDKSRKILQSYNSSSRRYPASLTKVMTLYMLFEALKRGEITLNSRMRISRHAADMPPTNLFLKAGRSIKVRDAIPALIVRSANDVAVVVAEHLGGTQSRFAAMMTQKARDLKMYNTVFRNASGLPDRNQYTTAKDMAILAISVREHFPEYYHFFNRTSFSYNGRKYNTHNNIVKYYKGADGLKTGYIRDSGYNLATSAIKNGKRVTAIVLGGKTGAGRNRTMVGLLDKYLKGRHRSRGRVNIANRGIMFNISKLSSLPPAIARQLKKRRKSKRRSVDFDSALLANVLPVDKPAVLKAGSGRDERIVAFDYTPRNKPYQIAQNYYQLDPIKYDHGISLGRFETDKDAMIAAVDVIEVAEEFTDNAEISIKAENYGDVRIYESLILNLSKVEALMTCEKIYDRTKQYCFVF